jgi:hypothetical protein
MKDKTNKQSAKTQKAISSNIDLDYKAKASKGGANSAAVITLLSTEPLREPSESELRKLNGKPTAPQATCIVKVLTNKAKETGSPTCTVGELIGEDGAGLNSLLDQVPEFNTVQTPSAIWNNYRPVFLAYGMITVS